MATLQESIRTLHDQIEQLEVRLGEVCGQYAEITAALAPFLVRYRDEILRYHKALVSAQRELADVQVYLGDTMALDEGEAASPLDEFLRREDASVQEQYERAWKGKEVIRPLALDFVPELTDEVRILYAKAVANLHPDLARTTSERRSRIPVFNKVNAAYLRRDAETLRMAVDSTTPRSNLPDVINEQVVKELRDRIYAMEELIARIEGQYYDFRYGDPAKVRAYARHYEAQGKDFIENLSIEIQRVLRNTVEELASLKKDIEQQ